MSKAERRRHPRYKAMKEARIYFDADGMHSAICTIRDLSEEGATIELPANLKFSNVKAIYLFYEKLMIPADLKWKQGGRVGLYFLKTLSYFMKKRVDLRICEFETSMRRNNQNDQVRWGSRPDLEYLKFFANHVEGAGGE